MRICSLWFKRWVGLALTVISSLAAGATPTAILTLSTAVNPLVGDAYCFTATLKNTGDAAYGPYLRLVLPAGLTYSSASYLATLPVAAIDRGVIPTTDNLINQAVSTPTGSRLILLKPPIGSMVNGSGVGGFEMPISICTKVDAAALPNVPLSLSVQGAYQYGDSPTGANGPILGAAVPSTVTPTLVTVRKINTAPESERPPGSQWPITYQVVANVAEAKTITAFTIVDQLPADLVFDGPATVAGGVGCMVTAPTAGSAGGTISVSCASVTGTTATNEVVLSYPAHIGNVLSGAACTPKTVTNTATLNGSFDGSAIAPVVAQSSVGAQHAMVQKSANKVNVLRGETVTYTLQGQTTGFGTVNALVLEDTLPNGLTYAATASLMVGGTSYSISPTVTAGGSNTTGLSWNVRAAVGADIAPGTVVTLVYTATVNNTYGGATDVLSGDPLTNSAKLTAGLTTGASACANTSAATVTVTPVTIKKTLLNPQTSYKPGDSITFRLQMNVPAGTSTGTVFKDFLPLPVFSAADIDAVFGAGHTDIVRATTPFAGTAVDTLNLTPSSVTVNATENSLTINWPTISQPSGSHVLAVDVTVRVSTAPFSNDLSLTNLMEASSSATGGSVLRASEGVVFTVNSPELVLTKGVLSTTGSGAIAPAASVLPVNGNLTGADSGDVVSFRITVENKGGSPAHKVNVKDTPPANLGSCTLVSVTDGLGAALATDPINNDIFSVNGLSLTNVLAANDQNPIEGGAPFGADTALVTVNCTVAAGSGFGATLTNSVSVVWAAASSAVTFFPAVSDTATVGTSSPQVSKALRATSESGSSDPAVLVGEVVRYRLVTRVPEGSAKPYSLTDNLPAGLKFLHDSTAKFAFVSNGAGISSSAVVCANTVGSSSAIASSALMCTPSLSSAAPNDGDDPVFDFGNITNTDNDADDEFIVLEFNALVSNLPSNARGTALVNSASLSAAGSNFSANTVSVTVQEPNMVLSKTVTPATADAGDTVVYAVTFTNNAGANVTNAYDLRLIDSVPNFVTVSGVPVITTSGGVVGALSSGAGQAIDVTVQQISAGGSVTVTYNGVLTNAVTAGQIIANTASLAYSSLPGLAGSGTAGTETATPGASGTTTGERAYTKTNQANISVAGVTLAKSVVSSSLAATTSSQFNAGLVDLAIGEQVTFKVTATLPEGNLSQLIITDRLPASANGKLRYVSSRVGSIGSNVTLQFPNPAPTVTDGSLSDGILDTVSYNFGTAQNPSNGSATTAKQVAIEIDAVVVNSVGINVDGRTLTNNASVQFGPGLNATASARAEIVEPKLTVVKNTTATTVQAGQAIPFTITIAHNAASHAGAFDVVLTDALPTGLTYMVGSLSSTGVAPTGTTVAGNTLAVSWSSFPLGSSSTLSFNAMVDATVTPGLTLTNNAALSWTSMPGTVADERTYSNSAAKSVIVSEPGVSKSILSTTEASTTTSIGGTAPDLTIGERVTYRVVANFIEGVTPNAVLVDQLPSATAAFKVVSSRIVSIGNRLSGVSPAVGAAGTESDSNADTLNDRVTWSLGTVTNSPDGVSDAGDQIEFEVLAVVVDKPVNQGVLANQRNTATLSYGNGSSKLAIADADVVEPKLSMVKVLTNPVSGLVQAGEQMTFRITLTHASSSATAFNVRVADTLPAVTNFDGMVTLATSCAGLTATPAGQVITFQVPSISLLTGSCTIDYRVNVNNSAPLPVAGTTYTNSAALQYDSQPVFTAGETRRSTGSASAQFTIPAPTLVKAAVSTSLNDTAIGFYRVNNFDLAIGELVDYDITIILPEGVTNGAVLTDNLPANIGAGILEVVGASVLSLGSNISTSLPATPVLSDVQLVDGLKDRVVFNFGDITNTGDGLNNANDTIVVRVTARVVNRPANIDSVLLTNSAAFTYNSGSLLTATAAVDLVEPVLATTKAMTQLGAGLVNVAVTLNNTGNAPAYGIATQDTLDSSAWDLSSITEVTTPPGYLFSNTVGPGATQRTAKFVSDLAATSPNGVLMPGASTTFVFRAKLAETATPTTPLINTATMTLASSVPEAMVTFGRSYGPKEGTAQLDLPSVQASKTVQLLNDADGSGGASPGDTLRYIITLRNQGTAALTNVTLDDVPDANTLLSVGSVLTTGPAATITFGNTAGHSKVVVNFASLAVGATATVTYDVTIAAIVPSGAVQLSNQARITSNELPELRTDDPTAMGPQNPTTTPVSSTADLQVTKTGPAGALVPGQLVPYTIQVSNLGRNTAANVQLTDVLPSYLSFVSANAPCAAGFPCSLGNLASGSSVTINLMTRLLAEFVGPSVSNTAGATSSTPDPVPGNNQNTATNLTSPQLTLAKRLTGESGFAAGIVEANEVLTYTLTVTNTGGTAITTYALTDAMTPATVVASVVASHGGTFDASTGMVTWTNLTVPAQVGGTPGVLTVTVNVTMKPNLLGTARFQNLAHTTGAAPPSCPGSACVQTLVYVPDTAAIPTFSEWGRILLMCLMLLVALHSHRLMRHGQGRRLER